MSKVKAGFSKDVIFEMRLKGFSREYRDGGGDRRAFLVGARTRVKVLQARSCSTLWGHVAGVE